MTDTLYEQTELPPAGHARDEVLKERHDNLQAQAETQTPDSQSIPRDHDALRPERNPEIQSAIRKNYLEIGTDHPYYKVKWVNYFHQQGTMVWQAKADGWVVATAREFPEAKDLVKEDGTIRIGDVMLMFIRMDEYLKLEQREKEKRLRQQYGVEAEIHDLADKTNRATGTKVFSNVETPEITGVSDRRMSVIEKRAARRTAARHLGNKMKDGTIPGVPIR